VRTMPEPAQAAANGSSPVGEGPGFRRILVAYDGSPSAEDALALARRLCDPAAGALLLTYSVPDRVLHLHGRRSVASAEEDARATLAEVRATLPPGLHVGLRTPKASSPARGLTELAEHEAADLIAIGSAKGAAGDRIGLARTAGRLLQGAPCAVAVAPPGLRETGPFRHVGVALDGSAEAAKALSTGFAIAHRDDSAMTLYTALDEAVDLMDEGRRKLRRELQERLDRAADSAPAGVNPGTVLLHGATGKVIAEACEGVVDLLVVGSRGYGPIQRALLGSVSEELIARARHPVLVIPRQPDRSGARG
jgi:nucleotide-binding universal stress UspA family protein